MVPGPNRKQAFYSESRRTINLHNPSAQGIVYAGRQQAWPGDL